MGGMMSRKNLILGYLSDCMADFFYYDRKNCEELKVDDIEKAILNEELYIEDMVDFFREQLSVNVEAARKELKDNPD